MQASEKREGYIYVCGRQKNQFMLTSISAMLTELSDMLIQLSAMLTELSAMLTELSAMLTELSAMLTELSVMLIQLSALLTELSSTLTEPSAMLTELSDMLTELSAMLTELPSNQVGKKSNTRVLWNTIMRQAVLGGSADLACDIHSGGNDSVLMVAWYKNDVSVYSYDVKHPDSHWKHPTLDGRSFFRTGTDPATLSVSEIKETDAGEYRCRVDFKKSPTRNTKYQLQVIIPPQKPIIFSEEGLEVTDVAGPYEEGQRVSLTCVVTGGRPKPAVKWWRGAFLEDDTDMSTNGPSAKSNQLILESVDRSHLMTDLTCQAANNNISQPVATSIKLDVYLKPLKVEILGNQNPLSADRTYKLECQSIGSRPAAKITWWLNTKQLYNHTQTISPDGNITYSSLTYTARISDHNQTLTCRAENPRGIPIQHNAKNGMILSNEERLSNLALQSLNRTQAGNYTCFASNVEGDGESNILQLKIMYKPVCKYDQKRVYGVARGEKAEISCEVDAYPPPDNFKWSFNNSASENIPVPEERFSKEKQSRTPLRNVLKYTPLSEMDYGTLICTASNVPGTQIEPCVYMIIAAGKPDPPFNCTVANHSTVSFHISCIEGFDGGQLQSFTAEVFADYLERNVSAYRFPLVVDGLEPGAQYKVVVYAANSKGRSEEVHLEAFTLKVAEKQMGPPATFALTPMVIILIVLSSLTLIVAGVILSALRLQGNPEYQLVKCSEDASYTNAATLPKNSNVILRNGDVFHSPDQQEVTYAELYLTRPNTEDSVTPALYAQLDCKKSPSVREIVTVRTPLMSNGQESCV
ncbi:hypothetical protein M8J76_003529 [Diaphorina citri]|nr:hypothetical protein M8J76_003529 [Diaphorina citri]